MAQMVDKLRRHDKHGYFQSATCFLLYCHHGVVEMVGEVNMGERKLRPRAKCRFVKEKEVIQFGVTQNQAKHQRFHGRT